MPDGKTHEDSPVWMIGDYKPADELMLKRAVVREGLSRLTETTIEFKTTNKTTKLEDIVGKSMSVVIDTPQETERQFTGVCTSVEQVGMRDGFVQYVAHVRPWLWLLTKRRNSRIFQNQTALEIIKKVFSDAGFSEFEDKVTEKGEKRVYCVQYRESDFDFVSRLMEEEGIYYFFDNGTAKEKLEKMILCDGLSSHKPVPDKSELEFYLRSRNSSRRGNFVGEWAAKEEITSGKVTLDDYEFTVPGADQTVVAIGEKGKHKYKSNELYDHPGHYRKDTARGTRLAKVRLEAEAVRYVGWRGAGTVRNLAVGYRFTLDQHPDVKKTDEFLITEAVHYFQHPGDFDDSDNRSDLEAEGGAFGEERDSEIYSNTFAAIPKDTQFRAPLVTPWPEISGMHTARVVGKSGEEISTDEHGRIKVKFHWDRSDAKDETSSCWVRVVTPWSGKDFGFAAVPRIDQEVVIQFEEGDPDRPICTGCLYNGENKQVYSNEAQSTQLGIRTNSTKGGGGYHELMFDDKKGEELVRLQSEKDYVEVIKNNAIISIGEEKKDPGNMSLLVHNDCDETIRQNKVQIVGATYNQTIGDGSTSTGIVKNMALVGKVLGLIKKGAKFDIAGLMMAGVKKMTDEATGNTFNQTIEGKHTHVVTSHFKQMVGVWSDQIVLGKYDQKIGLKHSYQVGLEFKQTIGEDHVHKVGQDHKQEIDRDHSVKVKRDFLVDIEGSHEKMVKKDIKTAVFDGNYSLDVNKGKITIEAKQKIELKVGKSVLTLDPSGVSIEGAMIKVKGTGMVDVQGKMLTMKADTTYTIKGGVATLIN